MRSFDFTFEVTANPPNSLVEAAASIDPRILGSRAAYASRGTHWRSRSTRTNGALSKTLGTGCRLRIVHFPEADGGAGGTLFDRAGATGNRKPTRPDVCR
jgi:hypothetical protein